jgi:hypothetical protein
MHQYPEFTLSAEEKNPTAAPKQVPEGKVPVYSKSTGALAGYANPDGSGVTRF